MSVRFKPTLNWLFVFIPVTLGLEHARVPQALLFFSAALAIIPVAAITVYAVIALMFYLMPLSPQ